MPYSFWYFFWVNTVFRFRGLKFLRKQTKKICTWLFYICNIIKIILVLVLQMDCCILSRKLKLSYSSNIVTKIKPLKTERVVDSTKNIFTNLVRKTVLSTKTIEFMVRKWLRMYYTATAISCCLGSVGFNAYLHWRNVNNGKKSLCRSEKASIVCVHWMFVPG